MRIHGIFGMELYVYWDFVQNEPFFLGIQGKNLYMSCKYAEWTQSRISWRTLYQNQKIFRWLVSKLWTNQFKQKISCKYTFRSPSPKSLPSKCGRCPQQTETNFPTLTAAYSSLELGIRNMESLQEKGDCLLSKNGTERPWGESDQSAGRDNVTVLP